MNSTRYEYRIQAEQQAQKIFVIELDEAGALLVPEPQTRQAWTALEFQQCPHCPLAASEHPDCPLALAITPFVSALDSLESHTRVAVSVLSSQRQIHAKVSAQTAVSAMMGVAIGACACPHTFFFRPMARFHLPLADDEETVFRVAGTFLLYHFFATADTPDHRPPDWDQLNNIYRNMHTVNQHLAKRIRAIAQSDSTVNALIILDLFTKSLPYSLEESLAEIRPFFATYLAQEIPR